MIRILIISICLISSAGIANAQYYTHYGRGFYGIGQISLVKCYNLEQTIFTAGQGSKVTELSSVGSFGFGAQYTTGYFVIKNKLSLGAGMGIFSYYNPDFGMLPIYGDLRFYMTKDANVPFLLLQIGGSVKAGKTFKNGDYFKFGVGYKGFVGDGLCIIGEASWQPFGVSNTGEAIAYADDKYRFKAVAFTIGFMFF